MSARACVCARARPRARVCICVCVCMCVCVCVCALACLLACLRAKCILFDVTGITQSGFKPQTAAREAGAQSNRPSWPR